MAAVVHHGGSGTTAAGLRAGKPTVICPAFGDQPFWGRLVAERGLGPAPLPQRTFSAARLAEAIRVAVGDPAMRERAAAIGERIRAEDGVGNAAAITGAEYEWRQHAPEFVAAGGTQPQLDALADVVAAAERADLFDDGERAVLRLTRELTLDVKVSRSTFERAREALADDQQVVELIGVVATYNMVSRFLVALEVEPEA